MFGAVPAWVSLMCDALLLSSLLLVFWVLKVNRFASRIIEVQSGQQVVSSGPYAAVRHPLYSGIVLMLLSVAPALGSYVTWPAFALVIPFFVYRLLNEE